MAKIRVHRTNKIFCLIFRKKKRNFKKDRDCVFIKKKNIKDRKTKKSSGWKIGRFEKVKEFSE